MFCRPAHSKGVVRWSESLCLLPLPLACCCPLLPFSIPACQPDGRANPKRAARPARPPEAAPSAYQVAALLPCPAPHPLQIRTQTLPASPCITLNPVPAPAAAPARRASALPDFSPEGWLFAIFMVGLVWGAATTCGANLGSAFCRAYSSEPTRHPAAAGAVQPAPVPAQAGGPPAGAMHQAPVAHAA